MNIYIDENMPEQLASGLNILQQLLNKELRDQVIVLSNKIAFGAGAADEDWLPLVGEEHSCAITHDYNIHRTRHLQALCEKYNLGMFYLVPPSKNGFREWDMVKLLIKHWEDILKLATKTAPPFAYRITSRGEIRELK